VAGGLLGGGEAAHAALDGLVGPAVPGDRLAAGSAEVMPVPAPTSAQSSPRQRRAVHPRGQHRQLYGERVGDRDQRQRYQNHNSGPGPEHTATPHRNPSVRYTNAGSQCGGRTLGLRLRPVHATYGV
jgi:hypothetical protein